MADEQKNKEVESNKLVEQFKELCDKYEKEKSGKDTDMKSVENIIESTKVIVESILELNQVTFHPEQMKDESKNLLLACLSDTIKTGPYLSPPHGQLVFNNQKTAIVETEKNDNLEKMGLLVSGDYAYGYIRCRECEEINLDEFDKREKEHRMTESEVDNQETLYYYPIRELIKFDTIRPIEKTEQKTQDESFFESTCIPKDWDLTKLDNSRIMNMHSSIHNDSIYHSIETSDSPAKWIINQHNLILKEMESRNLKHNNITELDRLSNNIESKIKLSELNNVDDIILQVPFLSLMGDACMSGHSDNINININCSEHDVDFIRLIKSKLKEVLPDNIKENFNLIPDKDGNKTTLIPIAELSIRFINPKNRIMMSCKQGYLKKIRQEEIEKLRGEK